MPELVIDPAQKLKDLQTRRDDLNSRRARMTVRGEQASEELKRVESEMTAVGTSPATIEEDLTKAQADEATALKTFESDLDAYEKQMVASEQTLQTPTS